MNNLDSLILLSAAISFGVFIVVHVILFRFIGRQHILKAFCLIFCLGWFVGLILIVASSLGRDFPTAIIAVAFDSLIYGLMCFLYVLYIFGPFESSIRFRLVFELYQSHPQGLGREEMAKRYNPDIFLKRRLDRMLASGDLVLDGKVYRLNRESNIFILLDKIALHLQKIIKKSQ